MANDSYNIDDNIPGWSHYLKLKYLAKMASKVPEGGTIVEIGSLYGRSAYALGMNKKQSVRLICIDPLPTEPKISTSGYGTIQPYCIETFKNNTKDIQNITLIRGFSPRDCTNFNDSVDLILIDGDHSYKGVTDDLEFWVPKVKSGGYVICDDYNNYQASCKYVKPAVDCYLSKTKLQSFNAGIQVRNNDYFVIQK